MLPLTEDAWAQSAEWLVIWYLKNEFEIIGGTLRRSESNYENKWKEETIKIRNFKMINGEVFALFLMRELITLILVWDKRMTILFGKSEEQHGLGWVSHPLLGLTRSVQLSDIEYGTCLKTFGIYLRIMENLEITVMETRTWFWL